MIADDNQDRERAAACLRMAMNAESESDRQTWISLADNWFRLSEFRLEVAKREAVKAQKRVTAA